MIGKLSLTLAKRDQIAFCKQFNSSSQLWFRAFQQRPDLAVLYNFCDGMAALINEIWGPLESQAGHSDLADLHDSVFVSEDAPVYDVPMRVIHRPLQSFTDEQKAGASGHSHAGMRLPATTKEAACLQVQTFVKQMQAGHNFTPIEILWVQRGEDDYYFAFGGCHRWQAHERLGKSTIKARLVKTTPESISVYLGRNPFR